MQTIGSSAAEKHLARADEVALSVRGFPKCMTYAASATRILDRDRCLANGRPCVPWPGRLAAAQTFRGGKGSRIGAGLSLARIALIVRMRGEKGQGSLSTTSCSSWVRAAEAGGADRPFMRRCITGRRRWSAR